MNYAAKSIRPFIGAKDYDLCRAFYRDLGFIEAELGNDMSVFRNETISFYLQRYYVREWIDNTMVFLEVDDVKRVYRELEALGLPEKYEGVRLIPIREESWGRECFLHDPSGVLWHFGEFVTKS